MAIEGGNPMIRVCGAPAKGAGLSLVLALAACGAAPPSGRGVDGVWSAELLPTQATLSLAPEESDNLVIGMTCRPGGGRVRVDYPVSGDRKAGVISVRSGKAGAEWPARLRPEGEFSPPSAEAEVPARDPVLAAFAHSGRLAVDGRALDARDEAERAAVIAFFALCAAAPPAG